MGLSWQLEKVGTSSFTVCVYVSKSFEVSIQQSWLSKLTSVMLKRFHTYISVLIIFLQYKYKNCSGFIEATREEVKVMKEKISAPAGGKNQRLSMLVGLIDNNSIADTNLFCQILDFCLNPSPPHIPLHSKAKMTSSRGVGNYQS